MTYTYAYKSSDGTRHEASMDAPSREAVFAALRERGIRAIKVVAADGAKANGELRGVRKRVVTAIAIAAALVAGIFAFRAGESAQSTRHQAQGTTHNAPGTSSPRHQLYGDPAVMEAFERGKFEDVLPREGDRMLAWFAQPGRLMCPKNVSQSALRRLDGKGAAALEAVLDSDIAMSESDSREVRELKQIVNGMRAEMRDYLANGNGTVRSYWRRLMERTRQEAQIYERTRRELEKEANPTVWEDKNEALRRLGLRTIPNPEEAE